MGGAGGGQRLTASAFMFRGHIHIHPVNHSSEGFGLAVLPVRRLSQQPVAAELGATAREVLEHSQSGVTMPEDTKSFFLPLLSELGVSSWEPLSTEALYVVIDRMDGQLTLTPHQTGGMVGMERGFNCLNDRIRRLPEDCSDMELGSAMLAAFSDCEPLNLEKNAEEIANSVTPTITIH